MFFSPEKRSEASEEDRTEAQSSDPEVAVAGMAPSLKASGRGMLVTTTELP